jgi:SAM-dependent methyltransferase
MALRSHWEEIYISHSPDDLSWYEPVPLMSMKLVAEAIEKGATSVVDIGGGASKLVDHVLDLGIERVAVVDISEAALTMSKLRLSTRARLVEWIIADATTLEDIGRFDVWHDRALFHFLTADHDRRRYVRLAERSIQPGRMAIVATFASDGPERCSGLDVRRYDPERLAEEFGPSFDLIQSEHHVHMTPHSVRQNFLYSTFRRVAN